MLLWLRNVNKVLQAERGDEFFRIEIADFA